MSQIKLKNSIDSVFLAIIKNKPCLYIWRVEELQLMPVAKDFYGIFFKNDTYLIYSYTESTASKSNSQHIHLWIGSESSSDDQGIGAFKMIELDEYLNNTPIQHRECQNYETERFLSYFKNQGGIKYLNGGWQTGDHYYEKEFRNRIFRVKGKRLVRLIELKSIDWSSLNRNESFLIDLNSVMFIWNGRNTFKFDKLQLLNRVKLLRKDRNVNIVIVEDGEEKELLKEEFKLFELYFPLKDKLKKLKNDVANDLIDDVKIERDLTTCLKLYKCSYGQDDDDDTIKIKIIEQKPSPLFREDLTNEDSFIIDNGRLGIYVWSGRKCNPKERQEAMRNALGFLQAKGYEEQVQNSIKVTCINEGYEPTEFRALFARWTESKYSISSATKSPQVKFDSIVLNLNSQLAAELQMIDDGSGSKKIWFIKNSTPNLLDENKHGQFQSQFCYIVEYKYSVNGINSYIIFYWIGRKSSVETQNIAFAKAIEFEKKFTTNDCHIVRVYEEKESKQFMAIFNGKIIILQENTNDILDLTKLENCMLQLKYYGHLNIKATQVDFKPTSLNSNNVFIICSTPTYYVWCGKASTGDERETAKSIILALKKEPEIVIESQEKDNFWKVLGGKQVYTNEKRIPSSLCQPGQIVRLFEILNENGKIISQEIVDFSQEDLNINEIMFLDIYEAIFIWIGSGTNKKDIDDLDKILKEYLKNDPCQRQIDTPVLRIRQGYEPVYFTGFFSSGWNENLFEMGLTYKELKLEIHFQNDPDLYQLAMEQNFKTNEIKKNPLSDFNNYPKYSYDELIKSADELPENVNTTVKELYLRETDFVKIFNMSFEEFSQKPAWKQKELKRSVHLF